MRHKQLDVYAWALGAAGRSRSAGVGLLSAASALLRTLSANLAPGAVDRSFCHAKMNGVAWASLPFKHPISDGGTSAKDLARFGC